MQYTKEFLSRWELKKRERKSSKLICGVAINDADFAPAIHGDLHPAYCVWKNILTRCFTDDHLVRNSAYKNSTVSDEWLSFNSFYTWWKSNHVIGYHIDKDLLSSNNIYSSETCLFIPRWLNNFTLGKAAGRGDLMIGVSMSRKAGLFYSRICVDGKLVYIKSFKNEIDAHNSWLQAKKSLAIKKKPEMDAIDIRIYPRVVEIIEGLK